MQAMEKYPRQVNSPAFSVSEAMNNGYSALQAARFAQLRHQTRRHQLHLPTHHSIQVSHSEAFRRTPKSGEWCGQRIALLVDQGP